MAFVYVTNVFELDFGLTCYGRREYHSLPLNHVLLIGGVGRKKGTEGSVSPLVGSIVVLLLLVSAFYLD